MNDIILFLFTSFSIAFLAFPLFIKLMETWKLFEGIDSRKIHTRDVPGLGGVPVMISAMLTLVFFFQLEVIGYFKYFIGALFFIFIVGLRDDLLPLRPVVKTINQIIPCLFVYFLFDIKIETFYSLWGISLPEYIALPLTIFTLIIITNSFNLIDGIDGLAGSLMIISMATLSGIFFIYGETDLALFLITFIGAIAGFLYFNLPPAKIFMGDTGALLIGFLIGCVLVLFMNLNYNHTEPLFNSSVGPAMGIIGVPLFDTFRIIIYRLAKGQSPLSADKSHIHHLLLELGWKHKHITGVFALTQVITIALVFSFHNVSDWLLFMIMGIFYFSLYYLVKRAHSKM